MNAIMPERATLIISAVIMHMERYLKVKVGTTGKIPQVISLTASPGAGDAEKSSEHLAFLCTLLDAL